MPFGCPFKKSETTPCVVTDGPNAYGADAVDQPICVGCERKPFRTGIAAPSDWDEQMAEARAKEKRR